MRLQRQVAVVGDEELVSLLVVLVRSRLGQRLRPHRITEREVVVLDGEDVREVARDLELEVELDRLHALVLDRERVLHPVADEAFAPNRERVVVEISDHRIPHEERGREVLDLVRREKQGPLAVDCQTKPRQEARVFGEETFTLCLEVAELVADAEGRALEYSELARHQVSLRSIRPPEDCASAFTTSSSTFTCGGRVIAKTTHSAMSSGLIASTPW